MPAFDQWSGRWGRFQGYLAGGRRGVAGEYGSLMEDRLYTADGLLWHYQSGVFSIISSDKRISPAFKKGLWDSEKEIWKEIWLKGRRRKKRESDRNFRKMYAGRGMSAGIASGGANSMGYHLRTISGLGQACEYGSPSRRAVPFIRRCNRAERPCAGGSTA